MTHVIRQAVELRSHDGEVASADRERNDGYLGEEAHPAHLAHHYESSAQQYEAAKLGMWLFIATEFLLFGGLFCAYAVYRSLHPEMFEYGAQFLSTPMGATNTLVLILSSMTIAIAVRSAQLGHVRWLVTMLALTFLGGVMFMGIKSVEYQEKFEKNLVWGVAFYDEPAHEAESESIATAETAEEDSFAADPEQGRKLWRNTCQACHGAEGEGVSGQAFDIRGSELIEEQSDEELLAFIKGGRMPFDPENTTGVQMPPKGGNPNLSDEDLRHIIAYIRTFEPPENEVSDAGEGGDAAGVGEGAGSDAPQAPEVGAAVAGGEPEDEFVPRSSIPNAPSGPGGTDAEWLLRHEAGQTARTDKAPDPRTDPNRPANLHQFFGIYFLMTGLHAIHVLAGMGVIAWLTISAVLGRFGQAYFTPVELGALYWHVVDVIWIFLFPLFYLI